MWNNYINNKVLFVLKGSHEQDSIITNRVKNHFGKMFRIYTIKYSPFKKKLLNILPFIKVYFGIPYSENIDLNTRPLWFNIDPLQNPHDAWMYHNVLKLFNSIDIKTYKNKFIQKTTLKKAGGLLKTYLFATGKSLENAVNIDFTDGYKIVCNTIVKDSQLWNYLKPDYIVAGDALYHFSDSLFAKEFRADLKKRLKETPNTLFVFPDLFECFVRQEFVEFQEQCIAIPIGQHSDISVNLLEDYCLPSVGNVLNLLMFPIGATLSKNIFLWGFDGRSPEDKDFWKNSDNHFYNEYVDDLKKSHPAFYNYYVPEGNQEKYVKDVHGEELERALQKAEDRGFIVNMMHFSHTKALQKRYIK